MPRWPESYQETHNKSQLMSALRACVHKAVNTITAHHSEGTTTFRIGPCQDMTPEQFERHLASKVGNVRRTPAHVWQ